MATPKQPQPERQRDWYPYYAGFTEHFVSELLTQHLRNVGSVLDPWNGSGTTTAVCAKRGLTSAGVDINPALTVIARARLTPRSILESLSPIGVEILEAAQRQHEDSHDAEDPLDVWMRRSAVRHLRSVQFAIHSVLSAVPDGPRPLRIGRLTDSLPLLACFYYCALFATTRDLLLGFRATNPTWQKSPKSSRHRIAPGWRRICKLFLRRTAYFSERLSIVENDSPEIPVLVRTASAASLPFQSGAYDACVTSPPYATRIDYVKSVLPELAVLGATQADVQALRQASTGSPVVKGVAVDNAKLDSRYGRSLLKKIESHPSKGSKPYYFPWMSNYFRSLQRGLHEVARVVANNGAICIIVQDSHYKALHIDLQQFVTQTMESTGRSLRVRQDYEVRRHRAWMNPRARRHLVNRHNSESLLVFR